MGVSGGGNTGREKKQSGGLIPFLPLQRGNADRLFEGSNEVAVIAEAAAFVYLRYGKGLRKELLGQRDFFVIMNCFSGSPICLENCALI